jgi:ribosomal protein S6
MSKNKLITKFLNEVLKFAKKKNTVLRTIVVELKSREQYNKESNVDRTFSLQTPN